MDLEAMGESIIAWALVGSDVTNEPVKGYPLSSFGTAIGIAAAYLSFVLIGSMFMRAAPGDGIKSRRGVVI